MNSIIKPNIQHNNWESLRQFTSARIALGKTGTAIPLKECLQLKLAHAQAKDAVYGTLDEAGLVHAIQTAGSAAYLVHSNAANRDIYLQRPDLGRRLNTEAVELLSALSASLVDIVIIVGDGLSALAVNKYAATVVTLLLEELKTTACTIAPVIIAREARVAIADEVGQLLKARLSVILIGERPGLSAFDSLGAYITYRPAVGNTDESRNCISNIRTGGLLPHLAVRKTAQLIRAALALQLTGIALKDIDDNAALPVIV